MSKHLNLIDFEWFWYLKSFLVKKQVTPQIKYKMEVIDEDMVMISWRSVHVHLVKLSKVVIRQKFRRQEIPKIYIRHHYWGVSSITNDLVATRYAKCKYKYIVFPWLWTWPWLVFDLFEATHIWVYCWAMALLMTMILSTIISRTNQLAMFQLLS